MTAHYRYPSKTQQIGDAEKHVFCSITVNASPKGGVGAISAVQPNRILISSSADIDPNVKNFMTLLNGLIQG